MSETFRHYEELRYILGCTPTVWSLMAAVNRYHRAFISVEDLDADQLRRPIRGEAFEEACRYWSQWLKKAQRAQPSDRRT